MPDKSLWGDLSDLQDLRTPKGILQEQAEYLTEATEGVLVGCVDDQSIRTELSYDLDVQVPALNNYAYTLLSITHDVNLYPVRVRVSSMRLDSSCEDEEEFEAFLGKVLSSKETRHILERLRAQAG